DAATAEISRSQIWQWINAAAKPVRRLRTQHSSPSGV
ncbi:hypothetical protein, partial [Streptomyces syringium]